MPDPTPMDHALRRALNNAPLPDPERTWHAIRRQLAAPASRQRRVHPVLVFASCAAAVVVGVSAGIARQYAAPSVWSVATLAGANANVTLRDGDLLETDATTRLRVAVGRIGIADIAPGSRLRRTSGAWNEHKLTLERGTIDAIIDAPPRLFFVQTPSALATDLGCAYRLTVTDRGSSELLVTAGWVALEHDGRESIVPAGLAAEVEKGGRPGTPYLPTLDDTTRAALRRLDAGQGTDADLTRVLTAMSTEDDPLRRRQQSGITLWHLAQRLDGAQRTRVVQALTALAPPPADVTTEGIVALDRQMLDRWRRDLNPMWGEEAESLWQTLGRRAWLWLTA